MNFVFTIIYTIEALFKIIAKGFYFHRYAYLREAWNCVDFLVVVFGLIELALSGTSQSKELRTLRTVRVLRPLKSLNTFEGIKKYVKILVGALPNFLNVGIFLIFIFCLLSILGLHQYGENLFNRCQTGDINDPSTW